MLSKLFHKIAKNFTFLPDPAFLKIIYKDKLGVDLNLKNPETFGEKIQWYKLNYRNPILTICADKYEVRKYVSEKIGEQYLNELLGVYDTFEEIDFSVLPEQFVIKCVHGSGYNILVHDKSKLNLEETAKTIKKWQRKNFYKYGREWAYKNIPPKIIIEKFLKEIDKPVVNDYKFFCFNGKAEFIQIDIDRAINNYRCFYNTSWIKEDFNTTERPFYEKEVERPVNLDEMIFLAEKLADGIPLVRVDFYSINNKTVFGEMTFYHDSGLRGFVPDSANKRLGDLFILPDVYNPY